MFTVNFKPFRKESRVFAPAGELPECDPETARRRHAQLIRLGRKGQTVEDEKPWFVYVIHVDSGQVCLSEFVGAAHKDDPPPVPCGPWAQPN
jgi:hypothetical protein